MTGSGQELLTSINCMRKFLADISHLLQSAEAMMEDKGWEATGTGGLEGRVDRIAMGSQWMPRAASQTFRNTSDHPNLTIMIGVVLYPREDKHHYPLAEPIVIASVFELLRADVRIESWQVHFFGWSEVAADGKSTITTKEDPEWDQSWGWSRSTAFGRPLVEITDESKLDELIIQPILKLVENNRGK